MYTVWACCIYSEVSMHISWLCSQCVCVSMFFLFICYYCSSTTLSLYAIQYQQWIHFVLASLYYLRMLRRPRARSAKSNSCVFDRSLICVSVARVYLTHGAFSCAQHSMLNTSTEGENFNSHSQAYAHTNAYAHAPSLTHASRKAPSISKVQIKEIAISFILSAHLQIEQMINSAMNLD